MADKSNVTPLLIASPEGHYEIVKLLLNMDAGKKNPSLFLAESEERSIVRKIISNGVGKRLIIPGVATENGSSSALTISEAEGLKYWSLKMEMPSDKIPQRNMKSIIFGNGSIHRFIGKKFNNTNLPIFIGEGNESNRLTFVLLKDIGYVYARGKGKVIFPDGSMVELGY